MTVTVLHLLFKKCACNVDNKLGHTRVFVLQGSAAAKWNEAQWYGSRFYSMLRRRYLLCDMPKKNIKIGQLLPKLQQMF